MNVDNILLGTDNFKTLEVPKRGVKFILKILSSREEVELTNRAYNYCKGQDPIITEDTLIDHQIKVFLLWKILCKPENVEERYFETMEQLENACDTETVSWLFEEYTLFKRENSPFSHEPTEDELEKLNETLKKNLEKETILRNLPSNTVLSLASYLLTKGAEI